MCFTSWLSRKDSRRKNYSPELRNLRELIFLVFRPYWVAMSHAEYSRLDNFQIVAEPENKAATLGSLSHLNMIHSRKYRSGVSSLKMLEENIQALYLGRVHKPFCPFFENFNRKTAQLFESGIPYQWFQMQAFPKGTKPIKEAMKPQVLKMDHLGICFVVFLIPLLITMLLFALELCFNRF